MTLHNFFHFQYLLKQGKFLFVVGLVRYFMSDCIGFYWNDPADRPPLVLLMPGSIDGTIEQHAGLKVHVWLPMPIAKTFNTRPTRPRVCSSCETNINKRPMGHIAHVNIFVIISLWKKTWPFILRNLNPFRPRMHFAEFGRNWPSVSRYF